PNREGCALIGFARGLDRATMVFGNTLANGEADTRPFLSVVVQPLKNHENLFSVFLFEPYSVVGKGQCVILTVRHKGSREITPGLCLISPDTHNRLAASEFQCVSDQICKELMNLLRIAIDN